MFTLPFFDRVVDRQPGKHRFRSDEFKTIALHVSKWNCQLNPCHTLLLSVIGSFIWLLF